MYKLFLVLMAVITVSSANGQSITTSALSNSSYCAVTSNESLTYSISGVFNPGNTFTAQLSDASGSFAVPTAIGTLVSTAAGIITITFPNVSGSGYRVRVISDNPVVIGTDNGTDISLTSTPGDPALFGSSQWNAYCYSDNNFSNYIGFYTDTNVSFDSRNLWGQAASPSSAAGYVGCTVGVDNHSVIYKREGFTCGYYQIDLTAHDDHVTIFKDGIQIFQHNGCCDSHSNIFTGFLTPSTTLEFRWREFTGNSYGALTVSQLPFPLLPQDVTICPGSSASITATGADSYLWSPAATLDNSTSATVVATPAATTTYTVTGTNTATGCTSSNTYTVNVEVPINLTLTTGQTFCQTGTQTLSTSGAYTYTWSPATNLNTTTGTTVTATGLTSSTTYTVTGDNNCIQESLSTTISIIYPIGDPNDFGANTWDVYCYGANNFTNYKGFYVDNTLSFDTRNLWGTTSNPSTAAGYVGCEMPNDNFSMRFKRQGFPCNYYRLDIVGNDDNMQLYIDGVLEYSRSYSNTLAEGIWEGFLGATSTVEFRLVEGGGNAYAAMNFVPTSLIGMSPSPLVCSGTSTTLTAPSGSYTYLWSPGATLNQTTGASVIATPTTTTIYTVTITDITTSCTSVSDVTVTVNPTPVLSLSPTSGGYCTTGSVTFTASGANTYTWSPATDLNTTTGNTVIASPTTTTTYTVTGDNNCTTASQSATVSVGLGGIDPTIFGSNKWKAYCYGDNTFTSIAGYYEENTLNFDTRNTWNSNGNPTTAPGYIGCAIANDNHSLSYKRKGFPCGIYSLSIPGHDDHVYLYVNGNLVYSHLGCCDVHNNVYYTYLDANSTVEFAYKEIGGGSYGALSFALVSPVTTTWTGSSSTDWHTASNWNNGVPTSGKHAVIPNTVKKPVISATAACNSITINSGGILTISTNNVLSVFGDWINNGSFVCNLSTLNFNNSCASVAHAISSNSSQQFHNINVRANHGVSVTSGTTELQGNLFVSTSFLTNNNLKLISNSNGTGSIDSLGAGVTFTGNVTVERMLFGTEGYRLIGSPISNATVEQWDDDFITSGFTGSDYPSYNYNNIFYYDETTPGAFDFGFENVTDISNALAPGRGYYAYIYPDFPYPMSLFPLTMDVTGTISRGSFNFAVTFTDDPGASNILSDGWNILANPYPAAIDWSKNCWTKTNVDDAFYIWDKTLNSGNGDMRSFVNGIGDATQFISSSQGFIIHTNASSPVLTATEGCKSATNPSFLRVADPENLLTVTLSNVQSGFKDNIYIQANEQATNSFDPDKDALYLTPFSSNVPSLYSKNNDTTKYGIQTFPLDSNYVIPVFITSNNPGQHSLKFDFSSKSDLFRCVTIQDIVTGTVRDILNDTSTYYFTTNNVSEFNRFNISFYKTFTTETTSPTCYGMEDGTITLDLLNNNSKEIKIRNSSGNIIYNNSTYNLDELIIQNLKAELYTIDILDNSILCSHYSEIITLENPEKLNAIFVPTTNPVDISQGYQTIVFNPSNNSVPHNSEWLMNGVLVSNQEILTHTFQDTGSYTIIHNLSTINCSSSDTLEIKVNKTLIENSVENLNLYLSNDFHVYSNNSTVFISSKYENKTVNISFVDLLGKTIYNEKINLSKNEKYPIIMNVSEGIYFLNIEENKNIESYKILILN